MSHSYLVVRATFADDITAEFLSWYRAEHLPHVMAIPGIARAYSTRCPGGRWTAVYELDDKTTVQQVFASGEADAARRDWERWLADVSELSVEVYASLAPVQALHRWN